MTREITSHKVNGLNDAIEIQVMDEPGQGNACHEYRTRYFVSEGTIGEQYVKFPRYFVSEGTIGEQYVKFQNGPIAEFGVNGTSNEALLAIVEDRLKCFQSGPYSCRENSLALTKIQEAMHWLHSRTRERVTRGVEGTSTV